jgi:serine/threonine protein phosphatase PrpC
VQVGFKTDPGLMREKNEDRILVDLELGLFMVADGLGGHEGGEFASSIAVEEIANHIRQRMETGKDLKVIVGEAIAKANAEIIRRGPTYTNGGEIGTTVVLALVRDKRVLISHAGDSRAYMITDGVMNRLTHDHSFIADSVRQGAITPEEARVHPSRHGLYSALGIDDEIEFETSEWPWDNHSYLLLCSDGLTDMLPDDMIEVIVDGADSAQEACDELVYAANKMGGTDNISVIVIM